ncbi:hypothetical protein ACQB60_43280 [Actinomycetota bacterium Odt1-20B]
MHRITTIRATVLLWAAALALSGCVSVPRPHPHDHGQPAHDHPQHPEEPPTPALAARHPRLTQAPARESLQLMGAHAHPPRPAEPAAALTGAEPPAPRPTPQRITAARAPRPATASPRRHPARPAHPRRPAHPAPHKESSGVCALGKKYGHWHHDSPEAVICHQAYGS